MTGIYLEQIFFTIGTLQYYDMATLHLQNSVKQHTAYKTPSLTDNKINSAPKNVMLKKGGDQGLWWGL